MSWSGWAAGAIAVAVGAGLTGLGVRDVRTGTVPVAPARALTAVAVGGLAVVGAAATRWGRLGEAVLGALLVAGIQGAAYGIQRRAGRAGMGRADVRLSLPFGWTLGWFGLAFLVSGLVVATAGRRRSVPFVPFLAAGYWFGLLWVVVRA